MSTQVEMARFRYCPCGGRWEKVSVLLEHPPQYRVKCSSCGELGMSEDPGLDDRTIEEFAELGGEDGKVMESLLYE